LIAHSLLLENCKKEHYEMALLNRASNTEK
jgi:hypothetical protein